MPGRLRAAIDGLEPEAARAAWRAFVVSRLIVLGAAVIGVALFTAGPDAQRAYPTIAHPFDDWPLGDLFDLLFAPFIQGDAGWYLIVARDGYESDNLGSGLVQGRPAFFPVYPLLIKAFGGFASFGGGTLAAIAISLVSFLGALYLLHRLTALELGPRAADATVRLIAVAPVAYFFSAPYTEGLFLLLSVGSIYAARRGHWAWAGVLAAVASGTRSVGVLLIVPLVLIHLYGDRRIGWPPRLRPPNRPSARLAFAALAPLGLVAFSVYLRIAVGDAQAWRRTQHYFGRPETVDPFESARLGVAAAWDALEGSVPDHLQMPTLVAFGFLVFTIVALVGVLRRLPIAYGAYSLALLVAALSLPQIDNPLAGLPRFTLVMFPLFMWLGAACVRARAVERVALAFTVLLALFTAGFAASYPFG